MTSMVTVGLVPAVRPVGGKTHPDSSAFLTARTDLGHVRLSFTERAPGDSDAGGFVLDTHVRACLNWPDDRPWWDAADVLYRSASHAAEHVGTQLTMHPGCAVYACRYPTGRIMIALRVNHRPVIVSGLIESRAGVAWCATAASAMHAWITAGLDPHALRCLVAADGSAVSFSSGPWSRVLR